MTSAEQSNASRVDCPMYIKKLPLGADCRWMMPLEVNVKEPKKPVGKALPRSIPVGRTRGKWCLDRLADEALLL